MSENVKQKLEEVGLDVRPARVGKSTVLEVQLRQGRRELRVELDDAATDGGT